MLDPQGRLTIINDVIIRQSKISVGQKVNLYFDYYQNVLIVRSMEDYNGADGEFFIKKTSLDAKGRIFIPASIRKAFPEAVFIPAERNKDIYILIIEQNKKSE